MRATATAPLCVHLSECGIMRHMKAGSPQRNSAATRHARPCTWREDFRDADEEAGSGQKEAGREEGIRQARRETGRERETCKQEGRIKGAKTSKEAGKKTAKEKRKRVMMDERRASTQGGGQEGGVQMCRLSNEPFIIQSNFVLTLCVPRKCSRESQENRTKV